MSHLNPAILKERRERARAAGRCITCCSRPATKARRATYDLPASAAYATCIECRERNQRLRADRSDEGRCTRCGAPGMSRWALCDDCRKRGREYQQQQRQAAA